MKFMVLIYNDTGMLDSMPATEFDATMRSCIEHADDLRKQGYLLESQQLEGAQTAKSVRVRKNRMTITDGPFSETKEVLGGFNLIEAENMEEAVRIASEFPWAQTGCVEVRPVRDFDAVRRRVGASSSR
ncbi:MAG TPA: YciI family protein [Gemmatimonadaceae bacterium]|nr:YciI family protein [Gemmatimonadaceae bacterium]